MSYTYGPLTGEHVYDPDRDCPYGQITNIFWEEGERCVILTFRNKDYAVRSVEEFLEEFYWTDKFGGMWRAI